MANHAAVEGEGVVREGPVTRELGGGAWCWFADPRAVYHAGSLRQTYVGWIDRAGDVRVAAYDHGTHVRTTAIVKRRLGVDDHNNPAILVRGDGRLQVFYSAHNGARMLWRVSAAPEDVSSWGPERSLPTNTPGTRGFTYPNPVRLAGEDGRIFLFWRGGNWNPTLSVSGDGHEWSPARTVIRARRGQRPYLKVDSDGQETIHLAFTNGHPRNVATSVFYAQYRGGAFYRANGRRIGRLDDLPFGPADADTVYDVRRQRYRSWVHDVAFDGSGHPLVAFAIFRSPRDHRYHYARWTGRRWLDQYITAAGGFIDEDGGEVQYSGGVSFDHEVPSVVYLSRQVDGQFEVEKWRTDDGGDTWSHRPITRRSREKNVRPITPRGQHRGDLDVLWMRGRYPNYRRYRTDIAALFRDGRDASPTAELRLSASRGPAPLRVRFDGRRSTHPAGSIAEWTWDFGDASPPAGGSTVEHDYTAPGRYFPSLTVTDAEGARDVLVAEVVAT